MIRLPVLATIALIATMPPAGSDENCKTGWSFGMVEDEGGPAPLAWTCPIVAEPGLTVRCGTSQHFALSYFEGPDRVQREPDYSGEFLITIAGDTFRRKMFFQALDGSLITGAQPSDGPLIAALRHGEALSIEPAAAGSSSDSFSLSGAREALEQLAVLCAKSANQIE